MRKINYPYQENDTIEKNKFSDCYFGSISSKIKDKEKICLEIKKIDSNWDLKKLLTADFDLLLDFVKKAGSDRKCLNDLFKTDDEKINLYKDLQRSIADFLIKEKLKIKTCYYCNIDFINPFEITSEYNDVNDFLNIASKNVLSSIEGISKETAKKIIELRVSKNCVNLDLIKKKFPRIGCEIICNLEKNINKKIITTRDHFTLDHILPKSKYPYLSISLFNLIPSCYSCNSKFKGEKEFKNLDLIHKISPSSKTFELDKLLNFKLKFDVNNIDFEEKINKIEEIKDVKVTLTNLAPEKEIKQEVDLFLDMFSLKGRYEFHNTISDEMIEKRKKYSDSQIAEIVKIFSEKNILIDEQTFKEHIFGSVIFEKENTNEPFEKYKKDIAKQLGLI